MTSKQASDALAIQLGAVNPRAVARSLVESIDADCAGGVAREKISPATFLILHQLIFILSGADVYEEITRGRSYHEDTRDVGAAIKIKVAE